MKEGCYWEQAHLHADADILHDLIDNRHAELGMVPLQIMNQSSEELDVAVLDLPRLSEREQEVVIYLHVQLTPLGSPFS